MTVVPVLQLPPRGRLDLRNLLRWLYEDGVLTREDAERMAKRFGHSDSSLHPLLRLAGVGLTDVRNGEPLDMDRLIQWLAQRFHLTSLRIDPLRMDASRVQDVMSKTYAESRRALPVLYGQQEVTIATCEPFDIDWVPSIEAHTRRRVKLVLAAPDDIARYTTEFYTLAHNVRHARKSGEVSSTSNFE
ncbi:MAG: hypothetical protein RLZZ494_2018, partial [Pseudomonadota bacterium]